MLGHKHLRTSEGSDITGSELRVPKEGNPKKQASTCHHLQ